MLQLNSGIRGSMAVPHFAARKSTTSRQSDGVGYLPVVTIASGHSCSAVEVGLTSNSFISDFFKRVRQRPESSFVQSDTGLSVKYYKHIG
ncbi:unnamed protein product [Protopolystoma xenopodis]|uniref:Uncharacterized protein n=1 Tax=Protopolystoma xenopodis TaxID=117903 RepID=A0A3S5FDR5_9PLAT|nr:unnamed protein product [Protopolystoma xenopodis]